MDLVALPVGVYGKVSNLAFRVDFRDPVSRWCEGAKMKRSSTVHLLTVCEQRGRYNDGSRRGLYERGSPDRFVSTQRGLAGGARPATHTHTARGESERPAAFLPRTHSLSLTLAGLSVSHKITLSQAQLANFTATLHTLYEAHIRERRLLQTLPPKPPLPPSTALLIHRERERGQR